MCGKNFNVLKLMKEQMSPPNSPLLNQKGENEKKLPRIRGLGLLTVSNWFSHNILCLCSICENAAFCIWLLIDLPVQDIIKLITNFQPIHFLSVFEFEECLLIVYAVRNCFSLECAACFKMFPEESDMQICQYVHLNLQPSID